MKKHYKIAFCGMGSIGRRHFKNTIKYLSEHDCSFQIDVIRSGKGKKLEDVFENYISEYYSDMDVIPEDYDIIFITNPTSMHWNSIRQYQNCTQSMFIEKPVTDSVETGAEELRRDLVCYVACPLRYTKVLQYLKRNIDVGRVYSVRAVCSTYLPRWHPQEDYRESYSARKDMGGGVAIDLIHEWDYLVWLFGRPAHVSSVRRKVSELEIDSEDIAVYLGYTENRIYELHLDYFGRCEAREMEIYLPGRTVRADIRNGVIRFSDQETAVSLQEERNEYQMREIAHFFDIVNGICENDNDIAEAVKTLRLAMGFEN